MTKMVFYIRFTVTLDGTWSWWLLMSRASLRVVGWRVKTLGSAHIYLWSPDTMSVCGREPSHLDGRGGSDPVSQLSFLAQYLSSSQTLEQRSAASHHYSAILLSWVCIIGLSLYSQYITDYTPTTTHSNLRIPFTPMTYLSDAFCSSPSHLHVMLPCSKGISARSRVLKAS